MKPSKMDPIFNKPNLRSFNFTEIADITLHIILGLSFVQWTSCVQQNKPPTIRPDIMAVSGTNPEGVFKVKSTAFGGDYGDIGI